MLVRGHNLEPGYFTDQGGGVEEYWYWCHTCDPTGQDLMSVEPDPLSSHGHIVLLGFKLADHLEISFTELMEEMSHVRKS